MRLVAERGAQDVALADVRLATGVTPAALARHCTTEEDLWDLTAKFVERRMVASWSAIAPNQQSPAERLRALLAIQIGQIMSMPAVREMFLSLGLRETNNSMQKGLCRVRRRFRVLIADILRDGICFQQFPQNLDPEAAARQLTEALQGMVVSWSLDARSEDVIEAAWFRLDSLLSEIVLRASAAGVAVTHETKES